MPTLAPAWSILSKSVARALDYDARLVPPDTLRLEAERLDLELRRTAAALLGKPALEDCDWDRVQLPGPLSGMGLRTVSTTSHAAFWASWAAQHQRVQLLSKQMHRCQVHPHAEGLAQQTKEHLRQLGIEVRPGLPPNLTDGAAARIAAGPWGVPPPPAQPGACTRYMSEILRLQETIQATAAWSAASKPDRVHMLSCGGAGSGMLWTALPDAYAKQMPDAHWRVASLHRLGLVRSPAGATCGLPKARAFGRRCGRGLDARMHHVWHCRSAAARLRVHNAIARALAGELRQSGGHVDIERAVPEMAIHRKDGSIEEAILDVTCWWPGSVQWFVFDVTVRFAGATRYFGADHTLGAAAARGAREKHARYGKDVLPLAYEVGGRLGQEGIDALQRVAEAATSAAGGPDKARSLALRLRRRTETALHFATADALMCALDGSPSGRQAATRMCGQMPGCQLQQPQPQLVAIMDCVLEDGDDACWDPLVPPPPVSAGEEEAARELWGDTQ